MQARVSAILLAACIALLAAPLAQAGNSKSKGFKRVPPGQIQRHKNGAPKSIPPGQIKRYTRGTPLPGNIGYTDILDLSRWRLDTPGRGEKYVRVNNDVYRVMRDSNTVVEAVGIVSDLLR